MRNRRVLLWIFAILFTGSASGQTAPGTIIPNQAQASYIDPGGTPVTVLSNQIDITTVPAPTLATLTFHRVTASGSGIPLGPTACSPGGGAFVPLPDPVLLGGVIIDPNQPHTLTPTGLYHAGEPLFVTLSDLDQNSDPGIRETVDVTISSAPGGDAETLRLTETADDSGLFAGYIQTGTGPPASDDCTLQVVDDGNLNGFYQDPNDVADSDQAQAIVDPLNLVFDSGTGDPVNGVTIRLVDALSGTPAIVYGADGTSSFPASITSGGSISDSSGQTYDFPPGGYRFPVVPAGDYRIEVDPPPSHTGFSNIGFSVLQGLPGAPFALGTGSTGAVFTVDPTLAFTLDLPVDPATSLLYLQKSTGSVAAGPGDFVQYSLQIENTSAVVQTEITIADLLPVGFRLMPGSTYVDDISAPDPAVGPDGRSLSFAVGDLNPGDSASIRYVTEITVGTSGESAINIAVASSTTGAQSNEASATLQLVEDLFTSKAIVVGRAILDSCDAEVSNDFEGVAGLRVYMEDGRYAITDEGGRFHFEGLDPGTHVVQLDTDTVPDHFEVIDCQNNSRFAGRNYSQFVNLRAGGLWRADFHLRERPLPVGDVILELNGERVGADTILYKLNLSGGGLPVDDLVVSIVIPPGLRYVPRTSVIGGKRVTGPELSASTINYRLGNKPENWTEEILLRARLTDEAEGELIAKAVASFDMPNGESGRTPLAENRFDYHPEETEIRSIVFVPYFRPLSARLTRDDRRELDTVIGNWEGGDDVLLFAAGHTDGNAIEAGHFLYADNHALSLARADAVAQYVAGKLNIAGDQIRISGHGPDQPIADNDTDEGRAKNRRVELRLERDQPGETGQREPRQRAGQRTDHRGPCL